MSKGESSDRVCKGIEDKPESEVRIIEVKEVKDENAESKKAEKSKARAIAVEIIERAETVKVKTTEESAAEVIEVKKVVETKEDEVEEKMSARAEKRRRRSLPKVIFSKFGTVVTIFIAVLAATLVGAKALGYRPFTVMSGSMETEYPVGSLIYVKPVDYKTLKVGDVISYVANDEKVVVTHRIVDIRQDEKDAAVLRFQTAGDANATADARLVHYKNVIGTPVLIIPSLGYFVNSIQQPPGLYIMLVVGTLLLAWTFLPGTLEERRRIARKSLA